MVAIVDPKKSLNLEKLSEGLKKKLPAYAQPLFIRLMDAVELTGTFKLIKRDLVQEGYNVNKVKDPIYVHDAKTKKFVLLTKELYEDIQNGTMRL